MNSSVRIEHKPVCIDEQGFLCNRQDWSEDFAERMAAYDGIKLYDDHWGIISYFRDYYEQMNVAPTMHHLVLTLGKQHGERFHDRKRYERYLYQLFPRDPYREVCKLAGLPRPEADT